MQLTVKELYELCKLYGERARLWRQKFAGLLPEVAKRRLHEQKGFSSIYEFAAKLAGMSEEQARRVLNLEKRFETMPILRNMLENGEVSINKKFEYASTLNLSPEIQKKLLRLQNQGIDINALLLELLEERELKIVQEKECLSARAKPTDSRYIPVATKHLLKKEYGEQCSIETCTRQSKIIHHTQRFSLAKTHNPKYLAPLCEDHHKIAHSIDLKYHRARAISFA